MAENTQNPIDLTPLENLYAYGLLTSLIDPVFLKENRQQIELMATELRAKLDASPLSPIDTPEEFEAFVKIITRAIQCKGFAKLEQNLFVPLQAQGVVPQLPS